MTSALALAAAGAVLFSAKAIFIKLAYQYGVDAETLITLRMALSAPFFLAVAWWSTRGAQVTPFTPALRKTMIGLGLLGYYFASYMDFLGLQYISAALERLVLYLYPTIVVLISWWWFKKPLTRMGLLALAVTYTGVVLVFAHDLSAAPQARNIWLGGGLVFLSALAYAVYLVLSAETIKQVGSARFTAYAMTVSCIACVVQFVVLRPFSALVLPWQVYAYSLVIAVFCTVIPTFMVSEALKRVDANAVSLAGSVGPVATIALGAWLLGESISVTQIIGAVFVIAGVLLITIKPAPLKKA
jgi:drug/metabolite transporter (DMT)-like permease